MTAWQTHFNVGDRADEAAADDLCRFVKLRHRTLPRAGLPDDVVLLHGFDDGLLFGDGAGQGLLAVDVFLAIGGLGGHNGVPLIRNRDHHRVDIVARQQLAIVAVGLAIGVAVLLVDRIDRGLKMFWVEVASGNHLAVTLLEKSLGVGRPHHAPADHTDGDAFRSRRHGRLWPMCSAAERLQRLQRRREIGGA